ncbi:hypothetical protein DACRYDRAFT_20839 [Dacryopinax primogenitus]|uniref:Uncharacterized protein n=1 Tax=Dacryopinax primogenitus (strain DJM 731) TaxID=1858805 RepID=M5GFM9_DACPD|nr:uncharacterized protein DACRYDRAFT_20839 [Dacryopinax primogenitus]EJU04253.1 hypothetical protein DACRYDRAFT_20839 [Dacryopinax primogenitus]
MQCATAHAALQDSIIRARERSLISRTLPTPPQTQQQTATSPGSQRRPASPITRANDSNQARQQDQRPDLERQGLPSLSSVLRSLTSNEVNALDAADAGGPSSGVGRTTCAQGSPKTQG